MSLKYVPPFLRPEDCDHEGDRPCSLCCDCAECGAIRAADEAYTCDECASPDYAAGTHSMPTPRG